MGNTSTKPKKANPLLDGADAPAKKGKTATVKGEDLSSVPQKAPASPNVGAPRVAAVPRQNPGASLSARARRAKDFCDKAQKIRMSLPLEPGEAENAVKDVWYNGYHMAVPKGVMVDVPEPIYEILDQHYRFTMRALNQGLISKQASQSGVSAEQALL